MTTAWPSERVYLSKSGDRLTAAPAGPGPGCHRPAESGPVCGQQPGPASCRSCSQCHSCQEAVRPRSPDSHTLTPGRDVTLSLARALSRDCHVTPAGPRLARDSVTGPGGRFVCITAWLPVIRGALPAACERGQDTEQPDTTRSRDKQRS